MTPGNASTRAVSMDASVAPFFGGRRHAFQQRVRTHYHAGDAIAALCSLLIDECLLQRTRPRGGAEPLYRLHRPLADCRDRRQTREHRFPADDHRARTALTQPAAKLGAVQLQRVAQCVKQRRRGIDVERVAHAVDGDGDHGWRLCLRMRATAAASSTGHGARVLERSRV